MLAMKFREEMDRRTADRARRPQPAGITLAACGIRELDSYGAGSVKLTLQPAPCRPPAREI